MTIRHCDKLKSSYLNDVFARILAIDADSCRPMRISLLFSVMLSLLQAMSIVVPLCHWHDYQMKNEKWYEANMIQVNSGLQLRNESDWLKKWKSTSCDRSQVEDAISKNHFIPRGNTKEATRRAFQFSMLLSSTVHFCTVDERRALIIERRKEVKLRHLSIFRYFWVSRHPVNRLCTSDYLDLITQLKLCNLN